MKLFNTFKRFASRNQAPIGLMAVGGASTFVYKNYSTTPVFPFAPRPAACSNVFTELRNNKPDAFARSKANTPLNND